MKATLAWLREFVPCEMEPGRLAEALTNRGLECRVSLEGTLPGVLVGEIVEVLPHCGSDRLRVCRVTSGREVLSIVCGAPNVRPGLKVPLALPGAKLPVGMEIEVADIKGVTSQGMLCSEAELEVGDDSSGIWILPEESPVGARVDEAFGLADWVFSFDLTPNRADCLSILGLAFEIAALERSRVRFPEISPPEKGEPIEGRFHVEIRDPDLCPRYVARIIDGVAIRPSPLWLRRRLQLVGLRPINNIVDVTNYVMWELGQPLHAFDLELLEGAKIVVQRARPGQEFVCLDGQKRLLTQDMLMIWDAVKPVAVAGVMGGENSEVRSQTRSVLIESAYFDPISIRRTAKALGMSTEASRRFERGIDLEVCRKAASRAAEMMLELAGGILAKGALDVYVARKEWSPIPLRTSRVNQVLGTELTDKEVKETLELLDLSVQQDSPGVFSVNPPTRRVDLTREIDLIEEIARVWGYDLIPSCIPGIVSAKASEPTPTESFARDLLVGLGFHEAITFSFIDPTSFHRLGLPEDDPLRKTVFLKNPIRQDQCAMRTTLVPGLLDTVHRNLHRRNSDLRIFELGRVFIPREERALPEEPLRLAGAMCGRRHPLHWATTPEEVDFFDLKGVVEAIFEHLRVGQPWFDGAQVPAFLVRGASARVGIQGTELGWLGQLSKEAQERWDLESKVFLFELDFDAMARLVKPTLRFVPLPRFPEAVRDLSILINKEVPAGRVLEFIRELGLRWLERVELFDVFQDPKRLPPGTKSLTFRIWYRSGERSLTEEDIGQEQERLLEGLERAFGAKLRT